MKKSQFNTIQIASILNEFDGGKSADEIIISEHGVSNAPLYKCAHFIAVCTKWGHCP